ncbi:MAG TPA: sulfur carrier protein ThiS [Dehalococcoidia bacterium]|jgi:sulfur carrier protein
MNITLNGKPHELEGERSIVALLQSLNVKAAQVAVALNGEVVRKRAWPQTEIRSGDTVEIVRAVGGG